MKANRYLVVLLGSLITALVLLPSILLPVASVGIPLLQGTLTSTAFVYLPYVVRSGDTPTATPTITPTSTPVVGCSTNPTLIGPPNGSTLNTLIPVFQGDSGDNPNATQLRVEIYLDPGFTQPASGIRSGKAQGTWEYRLGTNRTPATLYYWRAYLMCGSTQGPYSEVWTFTTGSEGTILPAPNLLSPTDGSTLASTTVTLQWSAMSGAVEYQVTYVVASQYFARYVNGMETTLSGLNANTPYVWWVQARNDYAWGTESTHWHFTTGTSESSASHDSLSSSLPNLPAHSVIERDGAIIVFEEQDTR
jgi:hypothetical protein